MKKLFIIWIFVNIFMTTEVLAHSPFDWEFLEVNEVIEKCIVYEKLQRDYTKDLKVNGIDFINGMLFIDTNLKNFYVTPYGKIF